MRAVIVPFLGKSARWLATVRFWLGLERGKSTHSGPPLCPLSGPLPVRRHAMSFDESWFGGRLRRLTRAAMFFVDTHRKEIVHQRSRLGTGPVRRA